MKKKIKDFVSFNINNFVEAQVSEVVYQNIFLEQCRRYKLEHMFYPVGAAASYGLMYLIVRIMKEQQIESVIELGAGQTTLLIDALNGEGHVNHVCYEQDPVWAELLSPKIKKGEIRNRKLQSSNVNGKSIEWYQDVEMTDFDFLLVDGPIGTERYSRLGCLDLVRNNRKKDFLIIIDDTNRRGELDTVDEIESELKQRGIVYKINSNHCRTAHTVIATEKYYGVIYCF